MADTSAGGVSRGAPPVASLDVAPMKPPAGLGVIMAPYVVEDLVELGLVTFLVFDDVACLFPPVCGLKLYSFFLASMLNEYRNNIGKMICISTKIMNFIGSSLKCRLPLFHGHVIMSDRFLCLMCILYVHVCMKNMCMCVMWVCVGICRV